MKKELSDKQKEEQLLVLKMRFEKNRQRHEGFEWQKIESKLLQHPDKLWSLYQMEVTGGEPDLVSSDTTSDLITFFDCSQQSPLGRRSFCYDRHALDARKEFKPSNSAIDLAEYMGIELLSENQYRFLQSFGPLDTKTSSWIKTPLEIRKLGGALFCDFRYNTVFVYHNGAESYYAARGFRGFLNV
jgi:hypothetical protein